MACGNAKNQFTRQTPAEPEDLALPIGEPRTPPPITAADHHLGDLQAPLQLIQYGDYECPFCAMAQPGVADLIRRHGPDMVFAFRHFPPSGTVNR